MPFLERRIRTAKHLPRAQRGLVTVVMAMLLLLVVSIIVLFSASVSLFEVRTGGNQFRQSRAFDASQQAVNLGLEFVRQNRARVSSMSDNGWLEPNDEWWERCPAQGTVADDFPCDSETDPARRAASFRFRGPLAWGVAQRYRLPLLQPAGLPTVDRNGDGRPDANDPNLRYRVGALLCLMDPTTAAQCEVFDPRNPPERLPTAYSVTVVSRGAVMSADAAAGDLPDAQVGGQQLAEARATLSQVFSSYRLISGGPEAPIIAANSVSLRGTFDVVPNSNAGGFGIPISIWSDATIDPNGTPKSCYIQEFLASSPVDNVQMGGITVCDRCQCPRDGSISYKDGGTFIKGNDIVDAVGNSQVTGARNFPADLFQYMFGVPKVDASGNARWTEVRDRAVLLDGQCTGNAERPGCCSDLSTASTGLFWSEEDVCDLSEDQVGTPETPAFVVAERGLDIDSELYFGVIYKFSRPAMRTGYTVRVNGGGSIYGALVADTDTVVDKATGNFAIVYSPEVMNNLSNSPGFLRVGPLPGSWNDLGSY